MKKRTTCGQLNISNINENVFMSGWIRKIRKMGEIIFGDLEDRWGITQFIIHKDNPNFQLLSSLHRGSVIQIDGEVVERKTKNKNISTGDIELKVKNLILINKSSLLPLIVEEKTDALEEVRMKYRYLDLRRSNIKDIFIRRHFLNKIIRDYFDSKNFIHVETPILTKPTPEGAEDFLVQYTMQKDKYFALPQSPQIYKQLLMIAGFDKYYQITKCFRNEELRSDRQLEFSQLDMEVSFTNPAEIMDIIEKLFKQIMKKMKNIDIVVPFEKISYLEAMNTYGSDKPDLRFALPIMDVTSYINDSGFTHLTKHKYVKSLFVPNNLSRKQIELLEAIANQFQDISFTWAKITESENTGPASSKIHSALKDIANDKQIKEGTIIFVGGDWKNSLTCLGAIRNKLGDILFLIDPAKYKFLWVVDWPLFEYNKEENRYVAMHHPFTAPEAINLVDFDKNRESVKAQAYDIVLNGYEIGGGSIRINNSEVQEKMFKALGMNSEEINSKFGFLIEALSYGCPTHGGIALGIDRILMILENKFSLKEVIAFPVNTSGIDVMMGTPINIKE